MIGKTISHYQILEKLGGGGMGVVYKARDLKLDRFVALKFLSAHFSMDEEGKQRFIQEAKAASALDHPNICNIHEINETKPAPRELGDGQLFIVMGYYQGQTLKQKLKPVGAKHASPFSIDESLNIAIQIAQGLSIAHQKGIIHRDIKPANIMITDDGMVKILDFGIAKLTGTTRVTIEGTTKGTVSYMSPEQIRGKDVGQQADIWSLGVLLYEMLCGEQPFKGDIDQAVIYSILNEEFESLTEHKMGVPEKLDEIVNKCLEKNPANRYQNFNDLILDLSELEEAPRLNNLPTKKVIQSFLSKKLIRVSGIFLLFAVILAAGSFFLYHILQPEKSELEKIKEMKQKNSLAIMYFENNSGDENLDYWRKAISDLLITDLSQSKFIRVLSGNRLYHILHQLDQLDATHYSSNILKEVGNQGRVNYVLAGNYIKAGEKFRINVILQKADTGELIASEIVEGKGEQSLFTMVDELTRRIRQSLDISLKDIWLDRDFLIASATTSSTEALKHYTMAEKFLLQGYYGKSIPLYEKAVAVDSGFAKAYNNLAMSYLHLDYKAEAEKCLKKAFDLSRGLHGIEKYEIQANYYNWQEAYVQAIEAYLELLEIDPFYSAGNNNLANVYARQGNWNKAIEKYKINIYNKDYVDHHSYFHLSLLYGTIGLYDKAREIIDIYQAKSDIHSTETILLTHRFLAYDYIVRRKYDLAFIELDKALVTDSSHPHTFWIRGDIYTYSGDLDKAEQEYKKILENDDRLTHLYGYDRLAYLYLIEGQIKNSIQIAEQCLKIADELGLKNWQMKSLQNLIDRHIRLKNLERARELCEQLLLAATTEKNRYFQFLVWYYRGVIYFKMDSLPEAFQAAQELQKLIKEGMRIGRKEYYFHLNGMLELNKSHFDQSVDNFQKGLQLLGFQYYSENYRTGVLHPFSYNSGTLHALFHDAMASVHYKNGDVEQAQAEYEKITQLTIGRLNYGDIYARSFYMLGKIYQQKGWEGKAIDNYTHFINLWKNCDPELQWMVADAREQIYILGGNI